MNLTQIKENYVVQMSLKTRSEQTINQYNSCLNRFLDDNSRVYRMSRGDIIRYMSSFRSEYSDSYFNIMGSALKVLFENVLRQPEKMKWFKAVHVDRKFHNIVTQEQFIEMMKSTKYIKQKLIIILLYSTGIRKTELINIKIEDVDIIENKRIFIRSLKKGKNRYVPLHSLTIKYLKVYLKQCTPKVYLFNGQSKLQYSGESVTKVCKRASGGKVHPHLLRHTFLTNVIEKEDVFAAMELAGHKSLSSTLHYNHISPDRKLFNPLDKLTA